MDFKEMGRRILKIRKERKLTQRELAELAGISIAFVGHIERGNRPPSLETTVKIAKALDVSVAYIIPDERFTDSDSVVSTLDNIMEMIARLQKRLS